MLQQKSSEYKNIQMESRSCQTSPVATVKPTPRPTTVSNSTATAVSEEVTTVTAVKLSDGREPQLEKLTPDGE